jgi:hypothetical protein
MLFLAIWQLQNNLTEVKKIVCELIAAISMGIEEITLFRRISKGRQTGIQNSGL